MTEARAKLIKMLDHAVPSIEQNSLAVVVSKLHEWVQYDIPRASLVFFVLCVAICQSVSGVD